MGAMGAPANRTTERGLERFIFFTDAVTAVAITLLVLPLVDAASEMSGTPEVWQFLLDNLGRLFAFALSFALIGLFWVFHHRFSEQLVGYDGWLLWLNLGWMLTIVALPLSTELMDVDAGKSTGAAIYIGNMLATSVFSILMRWRCVARPALVRDVAAARYGLAANVASGVLFALAMVIALLVPEAGTWALLSLFLAWPAQYLVDRVMRVQGSPRPTGAAPGAPRGDGTD